MTTDTNGRGTGIRPQAVWLGANFWSRVGGPRMWDRYDGAVVREELAVLAAHGLSTTRSFCYWPDFVPEPERLDERVLERFADFLDAHVETGLGTIPTFVVGHMSGENWDPAWREGRVHLPLVVRWNGERVGHADAGEMHFSFFQLVEHVARTRAFTAGTILGSGTVSNANRARGWSCIAEARALELVDSGVPRTRWLRPGDTVEIDMRDPSGRSIFGAISQRVVTS